MNLNMKDLFDESLKDLVPTLKKDAKEFFRRFFDKKLGLYFADHQEIQRMKDIAGHAWSRGINTSDPDLGLANKMASDFITENILNDDYKTYMRQYMDANWTKHLNEAMDKAMQHKANAVAFKLVKQTGESGNLRIQMLVSDYLTKEGYNTNFFSSMTCSEYIELNYQFSITSEQVEGLAKILPSKCIISNDLGTKVRVFREQQKDA